TTFSLAFPASLIQQGPNTLAVSSIPTAASLNEIYIDWFGIEVEEKPIAVADSLMIKPDESLSGQVALFPISGFSTPSITAMRLGANGQMEKLIIGSVSGSGPYAITFSDTVLPGRSYVIVGTNRYYSPSGVTRKQLPDLRSSPAGADYVIITHREFSSPANQLSAYRAQQGIGRTAIVYVDDIYDEFNFGHQSPIPIRSFLRAADAMWPDSDPAYVVLLGDANWDSKNNLGSQRRNLVPSYGNPVSDAFYAASASDGLLPEKLIGRIPVQNAQQAAEVVAHIAAYESQSLSVWNKTFLFMSAGYTSSEAIRFQSFSDGLIGKHIEVPPVSGFGARIYRPPSNVIQFEVTDSIRAIIDNGAIWMNFYGHAGTETWGNGISNPDQLINTSGKRHLVSDISCSTVRFAEPLIEAFGERMILGEEGGAIGYIGSSGFGFESPLRVLADTMYASVARDTVRQLGKMLFAAKVGLWKRGTSLLNTQALDQFTLLGDPATRLAIATKPDYAVDQSLIRVVPQQPTESDVVGVQVPVLNYGLRGTDTVPVSIRHTFQSTTSDLPAILLPPVGMTDTLVVASDLFQQPGLHTLRITLDPQMSMAEVTRDNNEATFSFFVLSQQLLPLQPLPSSTHHRDSIRLMFQNPNQPQAAQWNAYFEVDTLSDFSGPGITRSPGVPQGVYTTAWSIPAGTLLESAHYYWRGRLSSGTDSTNWVGGTFYTRVQQRDAWHQEGELLVAQNSTENVFALSPARLQYSSKEIVLHSAGFDDGDSAAMYLDGQNISIGLTERGYNVACLDAATASVEQFGAFRSYSDSPDTMLVEPLIQFLQNIQTGSIVLIALRDEGAVNKTERMNQAIESVGSAMIRSLGFRSSWAIIGKKGAPIGSVPEILKPAFSGAAILTDTVLFAAITGSVTTSFIGPATSWNQLTILADTSTPGTHASFDLIRKHTSGIVDTLRGIPSGTSLLLPFVSASVREIRLHANLSSDSPGLSPLLLSWSVSFVPSPELGLNYQTVSIDRDTVLEGETVTVTASFRNTGPSSAQNVLVRVSAAGVVLDSARIDIPASGQAVQSFDLPTAGLSGRPVFTVEVDPADEIPEMFEANNIYSFSVQVQSDTVAPMFHVSFDGLQIFDGDYVRPDPEIRILIRDNSPLPMTNPNNVVLRLDGRRITLGAAPDSLFETLPGPEKAQAIVRPKLSQGSHTLGLQVLDATGNPADTAEYQLRFNVETKTRLLKVLNFPNPFTSETAFTFHLTGATGPDEVSLKIYTVAGRLIYERRLYPGEVNIGFNRIVWDGRDQNGDPVANGVYFYK
ncbi:MAG: hypothetical protein HY563_07090, partial [Ignavibacteriales bacterium]|nr:hypothetical protein [Ignavibacteriales bacterium]